MKDQNNHPPLAGSTKVFSFQYERKSQELDKYQTNSSFKLDIPFAPISEKPTFEVIFDSDNFLSPQELTELADIWSSYDLNNKLGIPIDEETSNYWIPILSSLKDVPEDDLKYLLGKLEENYEFNGALHRLKECFNPIVVFIFAVLMLGLTIQKYEGKVAPTDETKSSITEDSRLIKASRPLSGTGMTFSVSSV